jgi:hypothetical protein
MIENSKQKYICMDVKGKDFDYTVCEQYENLKRTVF